MMMIPNMSKLPDTSPPKDAGLDYYRNMGMGAFATGGNRYHSISPEQPIQYNFATNGGLLLNSSATPASKEQI